MHTESITKEQVKLFFFILLNFFYTVCLWLTDTAVNILTQYVMPVATAALIWQAELTFIRI